jgi:hypothetical protein
LFQLRLNGVAGPAQILAANTNDMLSLTVIMQIAVSGSVIDLYNASSGLFTPTTSGSGDPSAYLTIVKLSP